MNATTTDQVTTTRARTTQLALPLRFTRLLKCSAADLSHPAHHLSLDAEKGWILRISIYRGHAVTSRRLKVRLRTHDLIEARERRDRIMRGMGMGGFLTPETIVRAFADPAEREAYLAASKRRRESEAAHSRPVQLPLTSREAAGASGIWEHRDAQKAANS